MIPEYQEYLAAEAREIRRLQICFMIVTVASWIGAGVFLARQIMGAVPA